MKVSPYFTTVLSSLLLVLAGLLQAATYPVTTLDNDPLEDPGNNAWSLVEAIALADGSTDAADIIVFDLSGGTAGGVIILLADIVIT